MRRWALPLAAGLGLVWLAACSDFARNRATYDAVVVDARAALAGSTLSPPPSCIGGIARFRTGWADLPRRGPTDPNVLVLAAPDGALLLEVLVIDIHGFRRGYAYSEPPMTAAALGPWLERCGGLEWETVTDRGSGWFELVSRLD